MKKRVLNRSILWAIATFWLTACSTTYHEKGFFGDGYTDYRLGEDQFSVTFRGNEYTDKEQVMKYALVRASELALNHGYSYFIVLSEKDVSKTALELSSSQRSQMIENRESPGITLTIKCFREDPEKDKAIYAPQFLKYNRH